MKKTYMLSLMVALGLSACVAPEYVQPTPNNKAEKPVSLGIDDADIDKVAREMIDSMLASPYFTNSKAGHYLVVSRVVNDTMQHFDTDLITAKIERALRQTGRVKVTSALGANGARDEATYNMRELRDNDEFDQGTIAAKGSLKAADLSLSGKIIQRNTKISGSKQRVDYYFQLRLTDTGTGLIEWDEEVKVNKAGSNRSVTW
ncbi:penicillin-binding protein activator LpoB [Campylobacter sp. MG1]|uniref:penicillin-binding protein activator LpoB n=1 Tax=Campylobacter sp. MG1 TaxID=2976332 RepID=UPI00226D1B30|nr:penicillin-binding protein activator LpoB [Campylobacter sp. MG1]